MSSTSEAVAIGPFVGGLNSYSNVTAIEDDELTDLNNFDIKLDGSLISRPPVTKSSGPDGDLSTVGNADEGFRILGYFTWTNADIYMIVSCVINGTYAYNTTTNAWSLITKNFPAAAFVQYANKAMLVCPATYLATTGGSWDPVAGFVATSTMPRGGTATIYKERMYIGSGVGHANPSRLFLCQTPDVTPGGGPAGTWLVDDFIDINNGDGQDIIEIINFNSAIVIFKRDSTYMFAYDSAPTKGTVQAVSTSIGLQARDCVVAFENVLYLMYKADAYSVTNWNWEQINAKVPFKYINNHTGNSLADFTVSIIDTRLICRYFDTYYIYSLRNKVWSKWSFNLSTGIFPSRFLRYPKVNPLTGVEVFYAGGNLKFCPAIESLNIFIDEYGSILGQTATEIMDVSLKTKTYNFNMPFAYKRLFWWGIDVITNGDIFARLLPIEYNKAIIDVTDSANLTNTVGVRTFIKFLKSIRFRQIAFELSAQIDGSLPVRVYSITAWVTNKEQVVKKVT